MSHEWIEAIAQLIRQILDDRDGGDSIIVTYEDSDDSRATTMVFNCVMDLHGQHAHLHCSFKRLAESQTDLKSQHDCNALGGVPEVMHWKIRVQYWTSTPTPQSITFYFLRTL